MRKPPTPLSERIEKGMLPVHPECGHILMTAVLPNIKAIERGNDRLRKDLDLRQAKLEQCYRDIKQLLAGIEPYVKEDQR